MPALASVPQNHIVRRPTNKKFSTRDGINNHGMPTFVSEGGSNQGPSGRNECVRKVEYKPTVLRLDTRIAEQNCKEVSEQNGNINKTAFIIN